jgi:hypothetical protein
VGKPGVPGARPGTPGKGASQGISVPTIREYSTTNDKDRMTAPFKHSCWRVQGRRELTMCFDPAVLNDDEHPLIRTDLGKLIFSFDQRKRNPNPLGGLRLAALK